MLSVKKKKEFESPIFINMNESSDYDGYRMSMLDGNLIKIEMGLG